MDDMRKISNILWRDDRAYYRRKVPEDLIAVMKKTEIKIAPITSDLATAKILKTLEDAKTEKPLSR